jgi:hypothetical protein
LEALASNGLAGILYNETAETSLQFVTAWDSMHRTLSTVWDIIRGNMNKHRVHMELPEEALLPSLRLFIKSPTTVT